MRFRLSVVCLVLALSPGLSLAQTPPVAPPAATAPPPAAVETAPLPPPAAPNPATPAVPAAPAVSSEPAPQTAPQAQTPAAPQPATPPAATAQPAQTPAPPPSAPAPAVPAPVTAERPTLVPTPGDPTNVEEVALPAKPAAIFTGTSPWDNAFGALKDAFARIERELASAGIAPAGRPVTVFIHTDDNGFRYDAMIPIARIPEGRTELTPEIRFGATPTGKAFRFVHKDAYEEIDGTYETIAAYLDAKDIVARDAFIEEYVGDMTEASDANLEVNIYVQPKE